MADNGGSTYPKPSGGRTAGFHKGSSGSPFHTEVYGDTALDPGEAEYQSGPRINGGVLGDRVKMNVSKTKNGRDY